MTIYMNNELTEIEEKSSLHQVLQQYEMADKSGIAVALNNRVVAKSSWQSTLLSADDKLTIITATAGG